MSCTTTLRATRRTPRLLPFLFFLSFALAGWVASQYWPESPPDRMEMKKSRGRNESHANERARDKAAEEYQKAKEALQNLEQKINKTKEEGKILEKLRDKVKHWKKKKDWKGENHSQKHKGN